jgi:hypothetical protein
MQQQEMFSDAREMCTKNLAWSQALSCVHSHVPIAMKKENSNMVSNRRIHYPSSDTYNRTESCKINEHYWTGYKHETSLHFVWVIAGKDDAHELVVIEIRENPIRYIL